MKEEFVTYETALALKELGFNEPCLVYWVFDGKEITFSTSHNKSGWSMIGYKNSQMNKKAGLCIAPLKQQVFRWFREKYDLWFRPDYYDEMREYTYQGSIHQLGRHRSLASLDNCKTVEELEAKCIDKLIEIVKNK